MTEQEKAEAIAEANRLSQIILEAGQNFQRARPKSRAAYHAQKRRAQRRFQDFDLSLRERGFYLYWAHGCFTVQEMTEEQVSEYAHWRGR